MAENSENIEAKLCAYVEGDLDEAGRVEIERHLEAHPNHRRLLAELTATRELLRFLPREQAPPELAEAFNAQLERSALLDAPAADANDTDIRGNLLPRLLAMAAIVLLTVGLGTVVYFALPHGESRTQLADETVTRESDGNATAYSDLNATSQPSGAPVDILAERRGGATTSEGALATTEGGRLGKGGVPAPTGGANPSMPEVVSNVGPDPAADAFARVHAKGGRGAAAATTPASEPVYVIVTADDQGRAIEETTRLLMDNRIQWELGGDARTPAQLQSEAAAPRAEDPDAFALNRQASRQHQATYAQVELSKAFDKREQQQMQVSGQARQLQGQAAEQPESAPKAATEDGGDRKAKDQMAKATADAHAEGALDAPAPAEVGDTAAQQQQQVVAGAAGQQAAPMAQDLALRADVSAIKARMTRSQVMQLSQALNRDAQQVELVADHPQLQTGNALLQQQQFRQAMPPAAPSQQAVARRAAGERESAQVAQAPAAAAAPAPTPTTRPSSPINLKSGPAAATRPGVQDAALATADPGQRSLPPAVARERQAPAQVNARHGRGPGERPERILAGQKLSVTVDELAAPGVDRTAVAEVGPDGTVRLPQLPEPLRVEGLTRAQAEGAISDAYKRSAGFDQATVKVEPADAPLANVPRPAASPQARPEAMANQAARQVPAKEEAKGDAFAADAPGDAPPGPSTRPSATTAPLPESDEEAVEVVILVQGATPPTTQASEPAQAQPTPPDAVTPSEEPAPSDEADVPPAAPEPEVPPIDGDAAPDAAGEPGAPTNLPENFGQPNE